MKRFLMSASLLSTLLFAGCVPSLHSFYTSDDISIDKELVGTWKQDNGKSKWVFSRDRGKKQQYKLVVEAEEDKKTKRAEFLATVFKIKGQVYIDLYPGGEPFKEDTSALYAFHVLPAHTIAKLDRSGRTLKLAMMSPEWANDFLKANPDAVAHTWLDKRAVLTAKAAALQKFVHKHRDSDKAFLKPLALAKQ